MESSLRVEEAGEDTVVIVRYNHLALEAGGAAEDSGRSNRQRQ